ncbi:MAG: proline--tRNA ligase [Anaerolineales bacterium]|nr:proline--tRNA ligase [Anaerolineales bacterium]
MRMTRLFSQTLYRAPSEADVASHQLLLRAGYIRQLGAGLFSFMPLGKRSMVKIEDIIREEMDAIDGQEMEMPVVNPADVWKRTNRWYEIGAEMARFKDRVGRDMVLAMTHEEVITDIALHEIRSYRQLPLMVYHIQTKFRDDPRPRAGLIRVREFRMKDSYTMDRDWEGLDKQYRAHYQAYFDIFARCSVPCIAVKSDVGMMGGKLAHEYMYLTPIGEDTLLLCDKCGFSSNRQVARFVKETPPSEELLPLDAVHTPDCKTIADLADFLQIPASKTAKAVFMMAVVSEESKDVEKFVLAILRGDMELNETKLTNAVKAKELRPATEEEIRALGIEPGYGSPIGIKNILVVVDDLIPQSPNMVGGANRIEYHYRNVNYGRDYEADIITDIAAADEGYGCPECGEPMRLSRGVEIGNIFQLGTRYSSAIGANYLDEDGKLKPIVMGSYGIGPGRLLACVAEEHNDENGLIMPISVAPYQLYLIYLPGKKIDTLAMAEKLYQELQAAGVEVLFDDRDERPGVKFNDADLIGIPLRLVVGERSLDKGGLELKRRDSDEREIVPLEGAVQVVVGKIDEMLAEISQKVVPVEYPE